MAAEDGVVTLTGTVESLGLKVAAERATKRVEGVRSVANDLRPRPCRPHRHRHRARRGAPVAQQRGDSLTVPAGVRDGHVTIDGTVSWMHQRAAAETAVRYLAGVTGISHEIVICSPAS